jgi:hypothetical protein
MTSPSAGAPDLMTYCLSMPRQAAVTAVLVGCGSNVPKPFSAVPLHAAAVNVDPAAALEGSTLAQTCVGLVSVAAGQKVLSQAGFAKP